MFVALGIRHAMRMSPIAICGLPCSTVFSTFSHKRHDFREKLFNIKCVLWFSVQLLSETFPTTIRNEQGVIINVHCSSRKVPVILVRFYETWNVSTVFQKKTQLSNFMKIRSVGAELFHLDGRTDWHDECNSRFSQYWENTWRVKWNANG